MAFALTPELLREIMSQAASVPVQAMAEMQERFLQSQAERHASKLEAHTQLLRHLSLGNECDPLRKLREKDPQFPAFSGKSEHFLKNTAEPTGRGGRPIRHHGDGRLIPRTVPESQSFKSWEAFVQALKPKFLLHTAEWSLFLELKQWHAERDWPSFHAKVQTETCFRSLGM